jgi:hypothetical protein
VKILGIDIGGKRRRVSKRARAAIVAEVLAALRPEIEAMVRKAVAEQRPAKYDPPA